MDISKLKEGEYYYHKHRNMWGVWKKRKSVNGGEEGEFIADFSTQTQAERFVYKANGWTKKNSI